MAEAAHGLPALGHLTRPLRQTPEPAPQPAVGPSLQQYLTLAILHPQQVHGPHRNRLFPARLRIPLGLALLPGLAKRRQRTTPTVRPASGADHRPQVHQSLRVVDQVRRRGALGRQRGFGMRPQPRQRCAAGGVALHGKHPAQHALHVAIQNGSPLAKGEHRNGRCRRAPHTGQGLQPLGRLRKRAARLCHLARRRMQVACPTVVAQPRPQTHHLLGIGRRQVVHRGESAQEGLEIRNDGGHLRLLQHHFRQPDAIGITQHGCTTRRCAQLKACLLPGEMVPAMPALPADQRWRKVQGVVVCHGCRIIRHPHSLPDEQPAAPQAPVRRSRQAHSPIRPM